MTMNRSGLQIDQFKRPAIFVAVIAASAGIGAAVGSKVVIQMTSFFYWLLFANVLLVAYLLSKHMIYSVLIYFYSLVYFNYYWRFILPGQLPDFDIPRLIYTFMWMVFLMEIGMGNQTLLPRTRIELPMLALVIVIIISMAAHPQWPLPMRQLLNGYVIPYSAFVLSKNLLSSKNSLEKLVKYFAIPVSIYFPLNQMFEHFHIDKLIFPPYILNPGSVGAFSYFEVSGRAMGVFLHPSATAFGMVATYLLTLWYATRSNSKILKICAIVLTVLVPPAVFFSYTRSAYAAFFSSMLVLALMSRRMRIFGIAVIVAAVLGVLGNWENIKTEKREVGGIAIKETAQSRLAHVYVIGNMFLDHPFTGVGFEKFKDVSRPYLREVRRTILGYRAAGVGMHLRVHNHFLSTVVEMGLPGLVCIALIYFFLVKYLLKARNRPCAVYDHDFVVTVLAVFANWFTISMFIETRFFEFVNTFNMTLAGIVIGAQQKMDLGLFNNSEKGE